MGLVCPLGLTVAESLKNALAGKNAISRCDDRLGPYGEKIRCRVAGLVRGFDASRFVEAKFADRYDPAISYAVAAADEAMRDAGLEGQRSSERIGCVIGVAAPGAHTYQRFLQLPFVDKRAEKIPPFAAMVVSGNMPAAVVALRHRLRGPNLGIVNACASGASALAVAADTIRLGRADAMIAGGTEAAVTIFFFASFVNAGAMNPTDNPERASRPFSKDRAGFINAEGCGLMVLEELESARARGATIHAILAGHASTDDAHHIISPQPDGETWARTMELALTDARVEREEVGVVSAHAASTPHGDLAEARALKRLFGARALTVPVSATKSMHGHAFGAAGAIESILALAAMGSGWILPTIHWTADPECDLDCVPNQARKASTHVLLKNSFGFGGTNTCLVFTGSEGRSDIR
jgi:3-oxoacyl-[acyl-carrier-protein] synthase II